MTTINSKTKAITDAARDWDSRRSVRMHYGDIHATSPLLSQSGLYLTVGFDREFCDEYNRETSRLIEAHGSPDWSPARRMPNQAELRLAACHGTSIDSIGPKSRKVSQAIQSRIDYRKIAGFEKYVAAEIEQKEIILLVFFGQRGECVADAIDLLQMCWMGEFEISL